MANILYRKQKQQISYDNGITWIDTGEYRVGDILENPSNCTSDDSKQCRWVELDASEGYYCDGTSKYTAIAEECTENGIIWTRTGNQIKGNTLIENNSFDCGYVAYEYKEVTYVSGDPTTWICGEDDCTKYKKLIYMYSTNGIIWYKVEPEDAIKGDVIEEKSLDCGYVLTDEITEPIYLGETNTL